MTTELPTIATQDGTENKILGTRQYDSGMTTLRTERGREHDGHAHTHTHNESEEQKNKRYRMGSREIGVGDAGQRRTRARRANCLGSLEQEA